MEGTPPPYPGRVQDGMRAAPSPQACQAEFELGEEKAAEMRDNSIELDLQSGGMGKDCPALIWHCLSMYWKSETVHPSFACASVKSERTHWQQFVRFGLS